MNPTPRTLRMPAPLERTGYTRSTFYLRIEQGLMVPPFKLGERCAAWPANEIDALATAQAAGKSDAELRALVVELLTERQRAAGMTEAEARAVVSGQTKDRDERRKRKEEQQARRMAQAASQRLAMV